MKAQLYMERRQLILHIGTGKTGSTALQKFFTLNKKELQTQGYEYPELGLHGFGHHLLGHLWDVGFFSPRQRAELVSDSLFDNLILAFNRSKMSFLLSTEAWTVAFSRKPQSMRDISSAFQDYKVKVVVYLRRQDKHAESRLSQRVKSGYAPGNTDLLDDLPAFYDYYQFTRSLADVFGADNLIVRPYEKQQFHRQSIFADFIDAIGLSWNDNFVVPEEDINTRISYTQLQFLIEANKVSRPLDEKRAFNRKVQRAFRKSAWLSEDNAADIREGYLLDISLRNRIVEKYADSNAKVAREFLGRADGTLFYDPPPQDGARKTLPLDVDTVTRIAIALAENDASPVEGR